MVGIKTEEQDKEQSCSPASYQIKQPERVCLSALYIFFSVFRHCWSSWIRPPLIRSHIGYKNIPHKEYIHSNHVVATGDDLSLPVAMVSYRKQWLSVTTGISKADRHMPTAGRKHTLRFCTYTWCKRAPELMRWAAVEAEQSHRSGVGRGCTDRTPEQLRKMTNLTAGCHVQRFICQVLNQSLSL